MSPTQFWQNGGKFSLSYREESLSALQGFTEVLWTLGEGPLVFGFCCHLHGPSRVGEATIVLIAGGPAGHSLRSCPLLSRPWVLGGLEPLSVHRDVSETLLFSQSLCSLLRKAWKVLLGRQAQTASAFGPTIQAPEKRECKGLL